jgi:hypothetical protein
MPFFRLYFIPALMFAYTISFPQVRATTPSSTTKPLVDEVSWSDSISGCRIGISPVKMTVEAGEPVDVQVMIDNEGPGDVVFFDVQGPLSEVLKAEGKMSNARAIELTEYAKHPRRDGSEVLKTIVGKSTMTRILRVNRILDLSRCDEYEIVILATVGKDGVEKNILLTSKPIRVKIVNEKTAE